MMNLLALVITIHFLAGAIGIQLSNRKLPFNERKKNWLKYFVYLFIFILVLTSILLNKNLFLGVSILIFSSALFEILMLANKQNKANHKNKTLIKSLVIFSLTTSFFSFFILLPPSIIAFTYTIVVIFDGASQISGQMFGKKKILPYISPNKTWEGLVGGMISSVATAIILHDYIDYTILQSLVFGILICLGAFAGDIAASSYKRAFGAKDFGSILPGQGGVLDRFDSFLASGAIVGLICIFYISSFNDLNINIAAYLFFSLSLTFILLITEIIHHVFKFKAEFSRVVSHIMSGIACVIMINIFTSPWYIIAFCIQSAIFIYVTKKLGLITSHHGVKRNTNGSSIFFFGILAAYLISEMLGDKSIYLLSVTVLSISDPMASMIGINYKSAFWPNLPKGEKSPKTYLGSVGFFISTLIILFVGLSLYSAYSITDIIVISMAISIVATLTELVSSFGTDNLFIPFVVSISLALLT